MKSNIKNFKLSSIVTFFEKNFGAIICASFGILYIPTELYTNNRNEFSNDFSLLTIPIILFIVTLMILMRLNKLLNNRFRFNYILSGAGISIFLCDLWLRASFSVLDGTVSVIQQDRLYAVANLLLYISLPVILYFYGNRIKNSLIMISFAGIFFITGTLLYNYILSIDSTQEETANPVVADITIERPNIYMIFLDALEAGTSLNNYLAKNHEDFNNFTYFTHNTTSYIYTNFSYPSFMSGTLLNSSDIIAASGSAEHKEIG